jgi:simple sugar transport system ATP-binding protein
MSAGTTPVIGLEEITKAYPGVVACDDVNIDLRAGEIHAVVGENGAGKTTLMAILYGLQRPDSGRIVVDGAAIELGSPRDALAAGIGFVQQHFSLIPTLTVAENLVLALRGDHARVRFDDAAKRVRELSAEFGLEIEPNARIEDLSVGHQQRAELLKALARDTRVLILDEPNALLTAQEWEELAAVLRRLAQRGVGIFLISHKLDDVLALADRVTVLRRGRVVDTMPASDATSESIAELMIGKLAVEAAAEAIIAGADPTVHAGDAPVLEVTDLWVRGERGTDVVKGVTLSLRAGEVLGIAGVEGSGQVELTEALFGARPLERGTVHLRGEDISARTLKDRQARGMSYVPADRRDAGLVGALSVAENTALATIGHAQFSRFGVLRPGAMRKRANELIEEFDIRVPTCDVAVSTLSGGNQQKVLLAREMSRDLSVLVCCYPTWGLDFAAAESIRGQILKLRQAGAAILYESVDLDELLRVTDRIAVLHHGRLTGELPTSEATAERLGLLMTGSVAA